MHDNTPLSAHSERVGRDLALALRVAVDGESVRSIAADLSISRQSVYHRLNRIIGDIALALTTVGEERTCQHYTITTQQLTAIRIWDGKRKQRKPLTRKGVKRA